MSNSLIKFHANELLKGKKDKLFFLYVIRLLLIGIPIINIFIGYPLNYYMIKTALHIKKYGVEPSTNEIFKDFKEELPHIFYYGFYCYCKVLLKHKTALIISLAFIAALALYIAFPIFVAFFSALFVLTLPFGIAGSIIFSVLMIAASAHCTYGYYFMANDRTINSEEIFEMTYQYGSGISGRYFSLGLSYFFWIIFTVLTFRIASVFYIPQLTMSEVLLFDEFYSAQSRSQARNTVSFPSEPLSTPQPTEKPKKFCRFCGRQIDADATVCPFCGAKLE